MYQKVNKKNPLWFCGCWSLVSLWQGHILRIKAIIYPPVCQPSVLPRHTKRVSWNAGFFCIFSHLSPSWCVEAARDQRQCEEWLKKKKNQSITWAKKKKKRNKRQWIKDGRSRGWLTETKKSKSGTGEQQAVEIKNVPPATHNLCALLDMVHKHAIKCMMVETHLLSVMARFSYDAKDCKPERQQNIFKTLKPFDSIPNQTSERQTRNQQQHKGTLWHSCCSTSINTLFFSFQ